MSDKPKPKRTITPEQRAKMDAGRKKAAEERRKKKEAEKKAERDKLKEEKKRMKEAEKQQNDRLNSNKKITKLRTESKKN